MELAGIVEGGLVAAALLGDDVEDDRLVLRLQELEGLDEQRQVVAVDRAVVAEAELLEAGRSGRAGSWRWSSTLWASVAGGLAGDLLDELRRRCHADAGVGRVGRDAR